MKDLDWATAFLTRFALPLLTGGNVSVGVPLLQKGTERLLRAVDAGLDHSAQGQTLSRLRRQMLAELGTLRDEILLSSDRDAVRLLAALHDVLFLSHPYGKELSASRRAGLIQHIRRQLVVSSQSLPAPSLDSARDGALYEQLLGRYSLLAKLWRLKPAMGPSLTVEAEVLDHRAVEQRRQVLVPLRHHRAQAQAAVQPGLADVAGAHHAVDAPPGHRAEHGQDEQRHQHFHQREARGGTRHQPGGAGRRRRPGLPGPPAGARSAQPGLHVTAGTAGWSGAPAGVRRRR